MSQVYATEEKRLAGVWGLRSGRMESYVGTHGVPCQDAWKSVSGRILSRVGTHIVPCRDAWSSVSGRMESYVGTYGVPCGDARNPVSGRMEFRVETHGVPGHDPSSPMSLRMESHVGKHRISFQDARHQQLKPARSRPGFLVSTAHNSRYADIYNRGRRPSISLRVRSSVRTLLDTSIFLGYWHAEDPCFRRA
jgi:hypothetical protein